jgi:hypothetical protein
MRTKYILIALLAFCFKSNAQEINNTVNFYHQLYQADLQAKNGNLDSAILICEQSFEKVNYVHSFLLRKVLMFAKQNGDKTRIKSYREQIKKHKTCPENNLEILAKIDSVLKWDQKYVGSKYGKATIYCEKCISNSECDTTAKKFLKSKELMDKRTGILSSNMSFLLNLIEEHGYISEEMIGNKNHYNFHVQLFHFDSDTNNRILGPILRQALLENRITPFFYAITIDRHLYSTTGKQKYWTSPFGTNNPNLTEQEVQEVLRLRERIGIFGSNFKFNQLSNKEWSVINTYGSYY